MSEQHEAHDKAEQSRRASLNRRGLIAGAAAFVATILASKTNTENVAAQGEALVVGNGVNPPGYQTATSYTWLAATPQAKNPAFRATNGFNGTPDAGGDGIQGLTTGASTAGIFGRNNDLNGVGGWGEAPNGTGMFGDSNSGSGVAGSSSSGAGLYGQSTSSYGVQGISPGGVGVYGASNSSTGVLGVTTAPGFSALGGITSTPNTAAFAGTSTIATAFAGFFTGDVYVNGNFTVQDPTRKHGAIERADGSFGILYSVESPEPWLEDFGTAKFVNGRSYVQLEPGFAEVVRTDDYHVFVAEVDGNHHLTVNKKTAAGFMVAADPDIAMLKGKNIANLTGSFSWRVIAKPKTKNKAERLASFTPPKITIAGGTNLDARPTLPKPRK